MGSCLRKYRMSTCDHDLELENTSWRNTMFQEELVFDSSIAPMDEYQLIDKLQRYPQLKSLECHNLLYTPNTNLLMILRNNTNIKSLKFHIKQHDYFRIAPEFNLTELCIHNSKGYFSGNDNVFNIIYSTEGQLKAFRAEKIYLSIYSLVCLKFSDLITISLINIFINNEGMCHLQELLEGNNIKSIQLMITKPQWEDGNLHNFMAHFISNFPDHPLRDGIYEMCIALRDYSKSNTPLLNLCSSKSLTFL